MQPFCALTQRSFPLRDETKMAVIESDWLALLFRWYVMDAKYITQHREPIFSYNSWKDEYGYRITWLSLARVVRVRKRREGNLGARPSAKEKEGEERINLPPSWRPFVLPKHPYPLSLLFGSMRKQPTFGATTTGFPAKWRLRNELRSSIMMTRHYPDQGSASDWSCRMGNLI